MPTHAELAIRLLNDAAGFFRTLGQQSPEIKAEMNDNASVFEQMATMLEQNPTGALNGTTLGELSGRLLKDAGGFFRNLSEGNEPIREQMLENANVFEQVGDLVSENPLGILE
jgi:hypothetical protein